MKLQRKIILSLMLATSMGAVAAMAQEESAACGTLQERLTIQDIDVTAAVASSKGRDNPASFSDARGINHIVLSPQADGGAKVAWMEQGRERIHITPLDAELARSGADVAVNGGSLRDMVAHDDGAAVLYYSRGRMVLERRNEAGGRVFLNRNLGPYVSSSMHLGALAWAGGTYGTYYGVHNAGHEGDSLSFINSNGSVKRQQWAWGCSHSIDMRLVMAPRGFHALCLSDAYPGTGLFFNNRGGLRLASVWGNASGGTGGRLAGVAEVGDNLAIAYTKQEGGGWPAYLAVIKNNFGRGLSTVVHGKISGRKGVRNLKIARYGTNRIAVSWTDPVTGKTPLSIYTADGKKVIEKVKHLPVKAVAKGDFKTLANGDIAWAATWVDAKKLRVMRLKYCEAEKS